ncbi:uncharacterized protein LOC128988061 [Macrosteles quadrilineatus]|uniref:uncharacterized protein LOC128988061 n=1 Tax=Macrosteles quadrilineatus TaxID=74068 RepID=UPI0023E183A4|nr:uncharacterized protein LOC128988061 [Macrosteles quadrilineatus]
MNTHILLVALCFVFCSELVAAKSLNKRSPESNSMNEEDLVKVDEEVDALNEGEEDVMRKRRNAAYEEPEAVMEGEEYVPPAEERMGEEEETPEELMTKGKIMEDVGMDVEDLAFEEEMAEIF